MRRSKVGYSPPQACTTKPRICLSPFERSQLYVLMEGAMAATIEDEEKARREPPAYSLYLDRYGVINCYLVNIAKRAGYRLLGVPVISIDGWFTGEDGAEYIQK